MPLMKQFFGGQNNFDSTVSKIFLPHTPFMYRTNTENKRLKT